MNAYITPIKFALFVFPFLAAFIAVPILLFEYHKYGSYNKAKGFVFYTFIFYMLCAYFLVILPLPDVDSVTTHYRDMIQPIPFKFIGDFFRETTLSLRSTASYIPALLQNVVLQPVFNIVMLIPFGIFMRYFFRLSFGKTLFFSLLLSLFYELTQLSGLYGIYSGPYRLFDVDDLILNTLGGVIGYCLAPSLTAFFPTRDDFDYTARSRSQYVSLVRRLMSFMIDHAFVVLLSSLISGLLKTQWTLTYFICFLLYYVGLSYLRGGKTLAQSFLHLKTAASDDHGITVTKLLVRSLLFFFAIDQPGVLSKALIVYLPGVTNGDGLHSLIYILIVLTFYGFLFMHVCYVIFSRKNLFFYESLSHTHIENTAKHN